MTEGFQQTLNPSLFLTVTFRQKFVHPNDKTQQQKTILKYDCAPFLL